MEPLADLSVEEIQNRIALLQEALARKIPIILRICPTIRKLEENMQNRGELNADDLSLAKTVCFELANNAKAIPDLDTKITRMGDFTDRVVLYDGDLLQIRAHIFHQGASETFIHNHQYHFISCCIKGSYLHKIYTVVQDANGKMYKCVRQTGGLYSQPEEVKGEKPVNVCAQPFDQGQILFISAVGMHTVTTDSSSKVVTITFRDKRKRNEGATVVSFTEEYGNEDSETKIQDSITLAAIKQELSEAIANFVTQCPDISTFKSNVGKLVEGLMDIKKDTTMLRRAHPLQDSDIETLRKIVMSAFPGRLNLHHFPSGENKHLYAFMIPDSQTLFLLEKAEAWDLLFLGNQQLAVEALQKMILHPKNHDNDLLTKIGDLVYYMCNIQGRLEYSQHLNPLILTLNGHKLEVNLSNSLKEMAQELFAQLIAKGIGEKKLIPIMTKSTQ